MGDETKVMKGEGAEAFRLTIGWLTRHAGFPRCRLPAKAEAMVCVAALAAEEEKEAEQARFGLERRKPGEAAALKAHALRRTQVHYKCDNSAKV